jgi:uncharacterized OsmC-like protein
MAERYEVAVGAGSLYIDEGFAIAHAWTGAGVTVDAPFTGAHFLHLAVAGCVLNDVYREADARGVPVDGVRVTARGGFDPETWVSSGIEYTVAVDSRARPADIEELLGAVDEVAEIPRALRAASVVRRVGQGDPATEPETEPG